jgi:peptidoglycan/xylan/chitin deacetylase (PgdA/CDA1 family)
MEKNQRLVNIIGFLAYYSGITRILLRRITKQHFSYIVMGHRLSKEDPFFFEGCNPVFLDKAIGILKKYFDFIKLDEFYTNIQENKPFKRASIVLTFDDGFRDNFTKGLAILTKHNVSAMIYLTYNSIEMQELPWSQRIGFALKNTKIKHLDFVFQDTFYSFKLGSNQSKLKAFNEISRLFQKSSFDIREKLFTEIQNKLKVIPPKDMMLSWDMVKTMLNKGIEFGAHTLSHPLLANINSDEARVEILQSKLLLEAKLGISIDHFAFPAGSMNESLQDYVKEIGFRTFYIKKNIKKLSFKNTANTSPFELRRIGLHNAPHYVIISEFAGVYSIFRTIICLFKGI